MAVERVVSFPGLRAAAANGATEILPLGASTPLRLDGHRGGWLVDSGHVDLFAVALRDGVPSGVRHPLFEVEAGDLIAGMPARDDQTIIAVGRLDTSVAPFTDEELAGWPRDVSAVLLDRWLANVATGLFGSLPAWPEAAAKPGDSLDLSAKTHLYALRDPVWVMARSGSLRIGLRAAPPGQPVPIAAGLSVWAAEDCFVSAVATAEAIALGLDADGLARFHTVVLDAAGARIAAAEGAAHDRIAARSLADRQSADWALSQLAGVERRTTRRPEPVRSGEPLFAAFAMVAAQHGIELSRTPRREAGAALSLGALARASGIGIRTVLLRGAWWHSESGPLLAWHGEERRPVALLPSRRRSYRLWDPADDSHRTVDESCAAEINPQAVTVYRPMPPGLRGLAGLLRFAGRGVAREAAAIVGMAGLAGLIAMLLPVATGFLFESAVPRAEVGQVVAVIGGLVLAALGAGVFDLVKAVGLLRLEARLEAALQPALLQRLLGLPVNFFRRFGTGDLTNRVLSIQTMRRLLAGNALLAVLSAVFSISSLAVILIYSPMLAALSATLVLVAGLITGGLAIGELREERARIALRGQEDNLVIQIIEGIAKLRVAAGETRVFAQWAALFSRQKERYRRGQWYAGIAAGVTEISPILALLVLYFAAGRLLAAGDTARPPLGLGSFLAINVAFGQLFAACMTMARTLAATLEIIPLFERLRPIVEAEPEAHGNRNEAPPLSGRVEVSHVSFRYTEGSPLVLDDVSLSIEPGSFIAVVGASASGKSTLLRLLLGFEAAERGDILYDGRSISTLDTASLRRQVGVVLQHARIITGSIFENITSGLPYNIDDAWAAARLAGFDAEIEAMPMGMHTLMLEGSATLSGGQRQRLILARALIGRPRLLLFDEATSALDNRSQSVVTESLARLRTTRIVIAHRLSTVERADCIFVLDRGRFVESGSFDELIARNGMFSRLARRQIL